MKKGFIITASATHSMCGSGGYKDCLYCADKPDKPSEVTE